MKKPTNFQPIIFLRIAWMENYQGVTKIDIPKGAGSYVEENEDGGEVFNFVKNKGYYYGYARIQKGRNIDLTNLGAPTGATELKGATVVFFATDPVYRSQYIVGWYENATLYNNLHETPEKNRGDWGYYLTKCKTSDGTLLKVEERTEEVEGPGQTNLWYPENYLSANKLNRLRNYLNNPHAEPKRKGIKHNARGWQIDAELRKKIEVAAMDAVADYFEFRGFSIDDVHKKNKGWDLEATKGNKTFHLEVKGTQNDFSTIELTPNEYSQMNANSQTFRLCIVSNALNNKKLQVITFYYDGTYWVNVKKQRLNFEKITSARVSLK